MAGKMEGSLTEDQIQRLPDLLQAFTWLQKLKISPRGIKDLEGAKCRLLQHLQETTGAGQNKHGSASKLMQSVLEADTRRRRELVSLYRHAECFLARLPGARRRELESSILELNERLAGNIDSLQKSDCAILVAGEVSAGKSSLLNLIMGSEVLPTSLLSCTSVICELKYGETKYALAHPWDQHRTAEKIDIKEGATITGSLAPYVHQSGERHARFPYKRVEIFWPFELLKGGIVIVDSPGIGESREMTRLVKEYLPSAFSFVYVINSGNAGGLQPDRLQDLLAELTKRSDDALHVFNPRSAIFVCNKWDQVPPEETEAVRKDTWDKLQRCWQGVQPDQIFYMSTVKASQSLSESGFVTSDFSALLEGIEALLPISLRCKLEAHYRWLAQVLRRSAFYLRVYIANETRTEEERKELTEYLHNQLDKLRSEAERVTQELRKEVSLRADSACDQLVAHLEQQATRGRLMCWEDSECPDGEDWDALQEILIAKVNKRIRREVNDWDMRNGIFADIQNDLLQRFREEFELMEDQLGVIEGNMVGQGGRARTGDNAATLKAIRLRRTPSLSRNQKVALGLAMPLLVPLGVVAGMVMLPMAGVRAIKAKLQELKLLKEYRIHKPKAMAVIMDEALRNFTRKDNLVKLVREQLQTVTTNVTQMINAIPNLIAADRILIERLAQERRASGVSLAEEYLPLYQACLEMQGKLDLFYAQQIRCYDIKLSDLNWDPTRPPLASGSFGDVYKVSLCRAGVQVNAAVKVRRETLDQANVTDVLLEEENLRRFRHENLITYFGTSARTGEDGLAVQLVMVMELCVETLREYIVGKKAKSPAKLGDHWLPYREAMRITGDYARQICSALTYLHERGLVHRDLKPQNILIDNADVIKLADVGLTKPERDISGTVVGTTCYSAPEVIEGTAYNKAADIFSLAMVVWELWYGQCVAEELSALYTGNLETAIRGGARPCLVRPREPPDDWKSLMTQGWDHNPKNRPSAEECFEFFEKFMKKNYV